MSDMCPKDVTGVNEGYILALDTSTDMLACAVGRIDAQGEVDLLADNDHLCRRQANVELVTTVQSTLADAGLTMRDITAVLVGRGPGSFTGVRIGIATAKRYGHVGRVCRCLAPQP